MEIEESRDKVPMFFPENGADYLPVEFPRRNSRSRARIMRISPGKGARLAFPNCRLVRRPLECGDGPPLNLRFTVETSGSSSSPRTRPVQSAGRFYDCKIFTVSRDAYRARIVRGPLLRTSLPRRGERVLRGERYLAQPSDRKTIPEQGATVDSRQGSRR